MGKRLTCAAFALVFMLSGAAFATGLSIGGGLRNTPAPAPEATIEPEESETAEPEDLEFLGEMSGGDALPVDPADCAEGTDALLMNPRDRYSYFFEQTDGSEQGLFMLLDIMNDEATRASEEGAVYLDFFGAAEDGALEGIYTLTAFVTDYGKAFVLNQYGRPLKSFIVGDKTCNVVSRAAVMQEPSFTEEDFEFAWDTMCFPFLGIEMMNAVCQSEDGVTYFLVTDDEGDQMEFVMADDMLISEIRLYLARGDGDFQLYAIVRYGTCAAPELPQVLIDALTAE